MTAVEMKEVGMKLKEVSAIGKIGMIIIVARSLLVNHANYFCQICTQLFSPPPTKEVSTDM